MTHRTNLTGTIDKILAARGFGFVRASSDGQTYFFHCHDCLTALGEFGLQLIGRKVRFDLVDAPKGPRAVNVQPDLPVDAVPSGSDYGRRLAKRD